MMMKRRNVYEQLRRRPTDLAGSDTGGRTDLREPADLQLVQEVILGGGSVIFVLDSIGTLGTALLSLGAASVIFCIVALIILVYLLIRFLITRRK